MSRLQIQKIYKFWMGSVPLLKKDEQGNDRRICNFVTNRNEMGPPHFENLGCLLLAVEAVFRLP